MSNPRAQERVQEAREKENNLRAQARELGIYNFENMSAFDLQQAVHQARNRARPVPAPRPPPDQITRTRPVPRPRTKRPLLIPHLQLPTQTPAPISTQAPISPQDQIDQEQLLMFTCNRDTYQYPDQLQLLNLPISHH